MPPAQDFFLDARLRELERLIAAYPNTPEAPAARRLAARTRYRLRRGLTPRSRRYLLADIRGLTRRIERTAND